MKFSIMSVGNEILSGDIDNTNATYIAKKLTHSGHDVIRIVVVPDVIDDIASELRRLKKLSEFVIVTGGLGVTHDDVTTEGVAKALNLELELNEEAVKTMEGRVKNRKAIEKMATLPKGSEVIKNDVGAAPGFIVDSVLVMPGVPAEMKDIFDKVSHKFGCKPYYEERVRVEGFEDRIADILSKINEKYPKVNIGSYPKLRHIIIKFYGKSKNSVEEAKREFLEYLKQKGVEYQEMT